MTDDISPEDIKIFSSLSGALSPSEIAEVDQVGGQISEWYEGLISIFEEAIRAGDTPQYVAYGAAISVMVPMEYLGLAFAHMAIREASRRVIDLEELAK